MRKPIAWILFFFVILLIIPLIPNSVLGGVLNSTFTSFNVTDITRFNWTSSLIQIGSYNNTTQVNIDNVTTGLREDYSQTSDEIGNYPDTWDICFTGGIVNITFIIQREDSVYTNYSSILNESDTEDFTLYIHPYCPPGRYSGYFTVTNIDNSTDKVKVPATIDIPITVNNTFDLSDNTAYFKGTMQINDSYHSYYFNTSEIPENITGLSVKMTQLSEDIDIFLFDDSGNLQGKSIQKGTSKEEILDVDLPSTPAMWEFRIYGNESSDYHTDLYFSSLNTSESSLSFGDLDPNATASGTYTLTNEDDRTLMNVYQYRELYHVDIWNPKNTSQDITNFFVPSFAQKVKVKIEWADETGKEITDWNLYLTDSTGSLVGNSTDKFLYSNKTGATREEFIVYHGPFDSNNEGFWNISVRNTTNCTMPFSYYNITAYVWMNENSWMLTNYTNGFVFNSTGVGNYTYLVGINLTVPETQFLDGEYQGYVKYNNTEGWSTRLPISFNVSSGNLVINNTFNSVTLTVKENIGFDRLEGSALTMDVTYNNTGSQPIWYVNTTSNYTLTQGNNNITFSVINWPSNPITPGTNGVMTIKFYINTTSTKNDDGVYTGWIKFNTTNTTLTSSSYPYKSFTLNLQVNLTNELIVIIDDLITSNGTNQIMEPWQPENITFVTRVYLVNGTQLTDPNDPTGTKELYYQNFTQAKLTELHDGPDYPLSQNTLNQTYGPGTPGLLCRDIGDGLKCYINATTPTNMVGGWYRPNIRVQWNNSQSLLTGRGYYEYVFVNRTGLKMEVITPTSKTINLDEGDNHYTYFNISVINYGMWSPDGTITMDNCAYASIIAYSYNSSSCIASMSESNRQFLFDYPSDYGNTINPNGTEACHLVWKITANDSVNSDKTCSNVKIIATDPAFENITGITINIEDTDTTTTTTTSSSDDTATSQDTTTATTTSTTTTTITPYLDITTYPETVTIEQGGNKSETVKVKNTNDTISQTVKLSVLYINSSWVEISTPSKVIGRELTGTYTVDFNIPNDAEVDDYDGKFNASSSYINVYKPFTLTITPGSEMKSEINESISEYQTQLYDLEKEIEDLEAKGYNISEVQQSWDTLRIKINNALTLKDSGDYKGAYDLFTDIENLLNETKTAILEAPEKGGSWWAWGKWVVIGLVGAGAAFLGYLFWPTPEGYAPKKPFGQKEKIEGLKEKFEQRYEKMKETWKKIKKDTKKTSYTSKVN